MLSLIETIIGFSVIMLLLSYLVKSLTSVVKNHVDYYSANLEQELGRLVGEIAEKSWDDLKNEFQWLKDVQWRRLGEEFLSTENVKWLIKRLGCEAELKSLGEGLGARLEVHKANVRYAFEKRTKNLALALGIALCLFLNINAFTIWDTLYNDQTVRAKFASPEYVKSAEKLLEDYGSEIEKLDQEIKKNTTPGSTDVEQDKKKRDTLKKQRNALSKQISHFRGEVGFGMGKIWSAQVKSWPSFLYEFFGSLLTGILVSIGAPYWHDLLRALGARRYLKKPETKP